MILSGLGIKKELNKNIFIEPYEERLLNPNSYNLRLADELVLYGYKTELGRHICEDLDMKQDNPHFTVKIPKDGYMLYPGKLYLGRTMEVTRTQGYVPMIEGRSSVGRLGIFVHITAGFGDVGFNGFWTLELSCIQPVRIYAGVEICQIFYHQITEYDAEYTSGKYQNNQGIQTSRMWRDFQK